MSKRKEREAGVAAWGILLGLADEDGNWRMPTRYHQRWWKERAGVDPKQLRAVARENLGKPFRGVPVRYTDSPAPATGERSEGESEQRTTVLRRAPGD